MKRVIGSLKLNFQKTFFIFTIILSLFFASAGDISTFEVDLIGTPRILSIEVPEKIYFGSIGQGDQTGNIKIHLNNTGNVNAVITPKLVDSSEWVFNHTYFQHRTADSYKIIGDFSFSIDAPTTGGVKGDYIYAKLDLRDLGGDIPQSITGHKSNVKFFAVAQ
jgi:hypothetical protein